jgi:hypothetical protein
MDRIAAGLERRRDDRCTVQIGARSGARQLDIMRALFLAFALAISSAAFAQPGSGELGGRARDADGDLAAIRDQQIHPFTSCSRSVRAAMK